MNYDKLSGGSRARLAKMRAYVTKWNENPRYRSRPESWREARKHGIGTIGTDAHGPNAYDDGEACALPASVLDGLRDCGQVHDILRLRHSGWFTDADASETICGNVWQLPARDGSPVYVAGYVESGSGYAVLDCSRGIIRTFDEKEDAASAADSLAEVHARREREHNEKWHAAREIQERQDERRYELRAAHGEARGLVTVLRELPQNASSRANICAMIRQCRERMAEALQGIAEDADELADYARQGIDV